MASHPPCLCGKRLKLSYTSVAVINLPESGFHMSLYLRSPFLYSLAARTFEKPGPMIDASV
jgi:hypothetical protein